MWVSKINSLYRNYCNILNTHDGRPEMVPRKQYIKIIIHTKRRLEWVFKWLNLDKCPVRNSIVTARYIIWLFNQNTCTEKHVYVFTLGLRNLVKVQSSVNDFLVPTSDFENFEIELRVENNISYLCRFRERY